MSDRRGHTKGLQQSWIMFSLQIFWDMQRELGPHLSVGESLLHRTGRQILEGYQSFLDFKGLEKLVHGYDIQCGNAFAYKKFIEKYIDSKNVQMSLDADEESAFPEVKPRKIPGFSLLRCDPAFCGLLLATIRKDNHELAIALASNQAHIIGMAHLYNATRCAGHLPKNLKWADMEWLIEQQGSDWIFMGNACITAGSAQVRGFVSPQKRSLSTPTSYSHLFSDAQYKSQTMTVHPDHPGLTAEVVVNGEKLREFADDFTGILPNTVTRSHAEGPRLPTAQCDTRRSKTTVVRCTNPKMPAETTYQMLQRRTTKKTTVPFPHFSLQSRG